MRLLHRNIESRAIVVPILASLASVSTSTTAGNRIYGEIEKDT